MLSDMSSLYTDLAGAGSVVAARMAVEDSGIEKRGYKVEFVSADHQNKPDVGSAIARQWYDQDKVDVIVDVPGTWASRSRSAASPRRRARRSSPRARPRPTSPARRARPTPFTWTTTNTWGARQRHDGARS
ncbi:MAG: ABC transporter substrate-binding protein [Burkholderiales bacterium]